MHRVGACITVRTGSKRLPLKALLPVLKKPLIQHLVERLKLVKGLDKIIICTTKRPEDRVFKYVAKDFGVECYRGSEEDVLHRIIRAADEFDLKTVVRVTGDDCFIDPKVLTDQIQFHWSKSMHFTYNSKMIKGMEAEIIELKSLRRIHAENIGKDTEYMGRFFHRDIMLKKADFKFNNYSDIKLNFSCDTLEDYNRIRRACRYLIPLEGPFFGADVVQIHELEISKSMKKVRIE